MLLRIATQRMMPRLLRRRAARIERTIPNLGVQVLGARRTLHTPPSISPLVGLDEDGAAMYEVARAFSDNELAPHAARWDEEELFPVDTLRQAASLGFAGLFVAPEHGGSGVSRLHGALVFEALATGCVSTAAYLTIHNMVGWMIGTFGTDEQKSRFLPKLCTMEALGSYCLTEANAGSDAGSLRTRADRCPGGGGYRLNGEKVFISGGGATDLYIVMARTGPAGGGPEGVTAFLVERGTEGLSFGAKERKLGWRNQPTTTVVLEDAVVPEENRLGAEGEGFKIAMRGLDGGRISIGTTSVGGAAACLDQARAYIKERHQFGRPLAANQHLQFRLADMASQLVASRLMIRHAAALLDAQDPAAREACAMAKRFATDNCFEVVDYALQMHGGYGYLRDYPAERFLRDTRVNRILEGTNEVMRLIVSRALLADH